jgi:uncharacterized membrane protein
MKKIVKWPFIIGGVLFIGGPVIGVSGTVIGMIGAFGAISETGTADPEKLSSDISFSLITTFIGIPLGLLGLGLLVFSLIAFLVTRNPNPSNNSVETVRSSRG